MSSTMTDGMTRKGHSSHRGDATSGYNNESHAQGSMKNPDERSVDKLKRSSRAAPSPAAVDDGPDIDFQPSSVKRSNSQGLEPVRSSKPSLPERLDNDCGHVSDLDYRDQGVSRPAEAISRNGRQGGRRTDTRQKSERDVMSSKKGERWFKSPLMRTVRDAVIGEPYHPYRDEKREAQEGDYLADLEGHVRILESQITGYKQTIQKLQSDLEAETQNTKEVKISANKMAYALENKELLVGRPDSDDVIFAEYRALMNQIRTWSIPFAQGPSVDSHNLPSDVAQEVYPVAPAGLGFLQTRKDLRLIVRGYVGLMLQTCIFRVVLYKPQRNTYGKDIWMDSALADHLLQIENNLLDTNAISDHQFHDWRALTATLISKQSGSSRTGKGVESHVTDCALRILAVVGRWAPEEKHEGLRDGLHSIIVKAVKLSQMLRCQRASWSIRNAEINRDHGTLLFDEATMSDKQGEEEEDGKPNARKPQRKTVEIVVTPALFKRGNSDGERYEFETCIERAEVKCRPMTVAQQPPRESMIDPARRIPGDLMTTR